MTTETDAKDDELLAEALERYKCAEEHWSDTYSQIEQDIDFLLNTDGAQWDDGRQYEPDKVKLVINKCEAEADSIINEMRSARPGINVSPVDDKADVETAKIIKGLARNTEAVSDAATAYDTAAFFQVVGGLGWIRVSLNWVPGTFDQEARIEAVEDYSSVLIDENSVKLDGSDMNYGFVVKNNLTEKQFKTAYPKAEAIDFNHASGWNSGKNVRVAEYYYKTQEVRNIHLLPTGEVITDEQLKLLTEQLGEAPPVVRSREDEVSVVRWCMLNGQQILKKTEWIGQHIPIVPVYGKLVFNNGKRHVSGLIKVLRDPQKLLNYWESNNTEVGALQPKSPYIAAEGQLEGYEEMWKEANRKNYPALIYKPTTFEGLLAPPPARQMPPELSMSMQQQSMMALQHIKSVTGKVYDEGQKTLGAESGKAVLAKERKSNVASFHYSDNQGKSIRQVGIILNDIYPKIYSGARIGRILGEDDQAERVPINQPFALDQDGNKVPVQPGMKPEGIYRLDAGKYDIAVSVGKAYSSLRQEFTEGMLELATAIPQVMGACADIIVRNMDFPGAQDAADRIRKTLPPGLADDKRTPEQAALAQATQAIELLKAKMAEMAKALEDKKRSEDMKHQIDLINAGLKREEINIKKFEASIKAMEAQAAANERLNPQDFAQMIQVITGLDERVNDMSTAFELLLDADEGDPSQPVQPATHI